MNIWILNHYSITPDYPGGTRHFELARNLVAAGHKVVIFASNFIHMNFSYAPVDPVTGFKVEKYDGLSFIWLKTRYYERNDLRRVGNMLDYCRASLRVSKKLVKSGVIDKPDVVIGSTVHPFTPVTAHRLARKYKVPFIFEIRDLWPQTFIDMGIWKKSSLPARVFRWIEKYTVKRARGIIALSPRTATYLEERYNYPANDITYIPNGVYMDFTGDQSEIIDEDATLIRLKALKDNGHFILLFSGSLISTNRLGAIINAAEFLKENTNLRIVLIGKGQEEEFYRESIQKKGLENIMILAPVRKDSVPVLLALADALLLNQGNVQWGSSNKLFDYMASGRPIISSVHARHNDLVSEVGGGLSVPPEDARALKDAIEAMVQKAPEEKNEMGEKNRAYVREHHDWRILTQRLEDMAKKVKTEPTAGVTGGSAG